MSAANCFWTKMFVAIPNRDERADRVGDRAAIQRGQSIQVSDVCKGGLEISTNILRLLKTMYIWNVI